MLLQRVLQHVVAARRFVAVCCGVYVYSHGGKCCSVLLQCVVAVCCGALRCVAAICSELQVSAVRYSVFSQRVVVCTL